MWQIRTIEEIETSRAAKRKKAQRVWWVVLLGVSWGLVLTMFLSKHHYAPRDFQGLVLQLAIMPLLMLVFVFGKPRARRRTKPVVGMLCRRCEKISYDEKQLVCSCGERLFRVEELKWVTTEGEKLANGEGEKNA